MSTRLMEKTESSASAIEPLPLTELEAGDHARLCRASLLDEDRELLRALGLSEESFFRVCKTGDPWILQVRSTRVGMSAAVAERLFVVPELRDSDECR